MKSNTPTDQEKIRVYEDLLHAIQLNSEVVMNEKRVAELIGGISYWSYANRVGSDYHTEDEQERIINQAFWRLEDIVKKQNS